MCVEKSCLCNHVGYQVKLVTSVTFNPNKLGESNDMRDLSVLVNYIGADKPLRAANFIYENDPYMVSRLDIKEGSVWNEQAYSGFYSFEQCGVWMGQVGCVNIKDENIVLSGLRIEFIIPEQLKNSNGHLEIYINDILLKKVYYTESGSVTMVLDVSSVYKEREEYLENAQRILKILLKDFDRVCRKYNLRYYLICGSLLGAVRNKNLIPWDDDIDVAMPRKDFDLLLKHVSNEWGTDKDIQFINYNEMGKYTFLDYMSRLVYMKEEISINVFKKIKGKGRSDIDNHMPMDIYVLDNASNNPKLHDLQTKLIQGIYGLAMGHRASINYADYTNRDKFTQQIVKVVSQIGKLIPLNILFKFYEIVRKIFKNRKTEYYFESNGFIYCIPWKFKKEWFGRGCYVQIDNMKIKAPQNYHEFLKMHYGPNYMKLPPFEVRRPTHSLDASGIF